MTTNMKRKRFRFLVHKPDYPPEVAAEIQACILSPRTSPHPLAITFCLIHSQLPSASSTQYRLLLQSRIKECAAVVKGKSRPFALVSSSAHATFPQSSRIFPRPDTKQNAFNPAKMQPVQTAPRLQQVYLMNTLQRQRNHPLNHRKQRKLRLLQPRRRRPHLNRAQTSPLPPAPPRIPSHAPFYQRTLTRCPLLPPLRSQACTTRSALQDPDAREAEVGPRRCAPRGHSTITLFLTFVSL